MYDYDILIIGSGPGGYVAGAYASQFGKRTAVIEKGLLGGCCLNRGCIPTKTILEAATRYTHTISSDAYGIQAQNVSFSWKDFKAYSEKIRSDLRNGVMGLLGSKKCQVINGEALLIDEHTVKVREQSISADKIILATGAHPSLPGKIANLKNVITSDDFWDLEEQPKTMIIVGGGIIGCEIASALYRLGTKVTIIEQQNDILPMFGQEAVKILRDEFEKNNVTIICGTTVSEIRERADGVYVTVGDQIISSEYLLWSTGRSANKINMRSLDLKYTNSGFIAVNNNYRTSKDNIFCIGDANGKSMLAHAAISQAMAVVKHISTGKEIESDPVIPQIVFTYPAIAKLGIMDGTNIAIGKVPFSAVGYSHVVSAEQGYFKVARAIETDTIIGAEIVGYNAYELIHNVAPYLNKNINVSMFSDIMYAHPTLTEGIKLAVEASYIRSPQV